MNTLFYYREKIRTHHRTDEAEDSGISESNFGPDEQMASVFKTSDTGFRDVRNAFRPHPDRELLSDMACL